MPLGYTYNSDLNGYDVSDGGSDTDVVIPETYNDGINGLLPVKKIKQDAFALRSSLQTIFIPDSVVEIEEFAFYGCTLTNIRLTNNITSIPNGLFFGNGGSSSLVINVPDKVISIGYSAFSSSSFHSIVFSNNSNLQFIGYGAFAQTVCSVTSIIFPKSLSSIADYGFYQSNLGKIYFSSLNAPTLVGPDVFTDTNIKIYRKKNFTTGYNETYGGKEVLIWSDNTIKSGGAGKLRTQTKLPKRILLQGWNTDLPNENINTEYTLNFEYSNFFNENTPYYINEIQSHKIYINSNSWAWAIQDLDPDNLYNQFTNNSQDKTKLPRTGWVPNEANPPVGIIIEI